ncbi:MAG: aminopeptidase [Firmicutes bacterium]|nr:aminopeptidase [Bacillota bacterium]
MPADARDPRLLRLARTLIRYSTKLQPGEKVLIELVDEGEPLARALIAEAYAAGAVPFLWVKDYSLLGALLTGASREQLAAIGAHEAAFMEQMDAYVAIRGWRNPAELSEVPADRMTLYQKHWWEPVHGRVRVPRTKWCVLRYPTAAMAFSANMSVPAFTDFYFNACLLDYERLGAAMEALARRLEQADEVRITGPGTDLRFSVRGMPAVLCAGRRNIPDGEVFTAPVRDSVNGTVTFNVPSVYGGFTFENVRLTFRDGRIVDGVASDSDRMFRILDTDEGSRYVGEFAIGVNPRILWPMKDTLFDEKIAGSFHLTPGSAYNEADNGNRSAIHWDLVCIQRPEWGGGRIYFDGELVREDGRFVTPDLEGLNPEHWE